MITRSPDNDIDNAGPGWKGREDGQIAPQPFPNQAERKKMSEQATSHPRKRDVNRDWKKVPRGSLATDY